MFNTFTRLLLLILCIGWLGACNLPEDPSKIAVPEWQPEIAAPVLNTRFSVADVLSQFDSIAYLEVAPDGSMSASYEADVADLPTISLLSLPTVPVPMFDTALSVPFPMSQIQQIGLKSGQLNYEFNAGFSGECELTLRFLNAELEGGILEETIPFTAPGTFDGAIDLSGYNLAFTDGTMDFQFRAARINDGSSVNILPLFLRLENMTYDYLEGNVGQTVLDLGSDTITFEVSTALDGVDFQLTEPEISLIVQNSYGIPVEVQAHSLGIIQSDGSYLAINHDDLNTGLVLNYPSLSETGQSKETRITLNHQNSNIVEALAASPRGFMYDFEATTHPSGDSTEMGFVTDSSNFSLGVAVHVPIAGQLAPYTFVDTIEIDLSQLDLVESGGFILITENGFPIGLSLQAEFMDANSNVLDQLFASSTRILEGAPVNASGRVTEVAVERIEAQLPASRMAALQEATQIRIEAIVETTAAGTKPVRLYNDYTLGMKLGVLAKVNPF